MDSKLDSELNQMKIVDDKASPEFKGSDGWPIASSYQSVYSPADSTGDISIDSSGSSISTSGLISASTIDQKMVQKRHHHQQQQQQLRQKEHNPLASSEPANDPISNEINSGMGYKLNHSNVYSAYKHNFHSGYSLYTVNSNNSYSPAAGRVPVTSYQPYSPSSGASGSYVSTYSSTSSMPSSYIDTSKSSPNSYVGTDSASSSEGYMYAESNHSTSSYLAYTINDEVPLNIDVPLDHNTPKVNIWTDEKCEQEGLCETWNQKFQYIMDLPEDEQKYKYLSTVANDFVYCANTFGKIIISEKNLPDNLKTIKPASMGGVAGGTKYKCQDIIFKFVVDVEIAPGLWMYGDTNRSDEKAQKSAGHELKGLNHFMEHSNGLIRFPLMAIIDYRGYRLLAISNLPITKNSIVYGSNDGGKTIHNTDPIVEKEMERLARLMNTKGHMVGLSAPTFMFGPGDIEVHKGTDGRYYMLDFARAFPPEYPAHIHGNVGREIFYSMLRPELILKSKSALSPDAFSGWQTGKDEDDSNQEVIEMTTMYHRSIIPEVAAFIQKALEEDHICEASDDFFDSLFLKDLKRFTNCNNYNAYQQKSYEVIRMVNLLHGRGINLRYLGRVCQMIKDRGFKSILFTEMVARVWKKLILAKFREKMEQVNRPSDEPKIILAEVFDLLLNIQRACEFNTFWSSIAPGNFKFAALRAFPNCLSKGEASNEYDLRNSFDIKLLVFRIIQMMNIKINSDALSQFASNPRYVISQYDIVEIESRVKYPTVIDYASGSKLIFEVKKRLLEPKVPPAELIRWVEMGQEKLMMAQRSMPMSSKIIMRKAASYILKSTLSNQVLASYLLIRKGINMLRHCWSHSQSDKGILVLWGVMHLKVATHYLFFSIDVVHFKQQLAIVKTKLESAMEEVDLKEVAIPYLRMALPNGALSQDNYGESTKKCKVYDLISFVYLSLQCPADSKLKAFLREAFKIIQEISHLYIQPQLRHLLNDDFMYEYFDHLPNIKKLILSDQIFTPKVALSASRFKHLTTINLTDVDVREAPHPVTDLHHSDDSILLNTNESSNSISADGGASDAGAESINTLAKLIHKWFLECNNLTNIHLGGQWINDETFENIVPLMCNIKDFSLTNTSVTSKTMIAMAPLVRLTKLSLRKSPGITDEGMIPFLENQNILTDVTLSLRNITDETAKALANHSIRFTKLDLSYCMQLTSNGISDIVRSAPGLQALRLTMTQADNSLIEALEANGCRTLVSLSVEGSLMTGEAPIQALYFLEPPLTHLRLSTYEGDYSVLWTLFRKLPALTHIRLPTNLNLVNFMAIYRTLIDQNDQVMEVPLKNITEVDLSDLTVSVQSLADFLDLTPLVESLIMDNLTFVDSNNKTIPLDDNHIAIIGNYTLNLKELGLSSFPIDKRGVANMLSRCTSMRRIIMNNCASITPEILFELQVEYPHISFVCDHTKYSLQSPEMVKYRYE